MFSEGLQIIPRVRVEKQVLDPLTIIVQNFVSTGQPDYASLLNRLKADPIMEPHIFGIKDIERALKTSDLSPYDTFRKDETNIAGFEAYLTEIENPSARIFAAWLMRRRAVENIMDEYTPAWGGTLRVDGITDPVYQAKHFAKLKRDILNPNSAVQINDLASLKVEDLVEKILLGEIDVERIAF